MKCKLTIIECDIESIRPYPGNPRKTDAAVRPVANSIREFGFRQPIVVDADKVIVVGHVRYQAAQLLGMKTVPVHVAADLTPQQAKAFRIADNKSGEFSEWDENLLSVELAQLLKEGGDLTLTQFDPTELDTLLALQCPSEPEDDGGMEIPFEIAQARSGIRGKIVRFDGYKIPLTLEEWEQLCQAVDAHVERTGSHYGFFASLLGGR